MWSVEVGHVVHAALPRTLGSVVAGALASGLTVLGVDAADGAATEAGVDETLGAREVGEVLPSSGDNAVVREDRGFGVLRGGHETSLQEESGHA